MNEDLILLIEKILGKNDSLKFKPIAKKGNHTMLHIIRAKDYDEMSYHVAKLIADEVRAQEKPVLLICKTVIGFGSPNRSGKAKSHGEPLGEDEVRLTKQALGLPADVDFYSPPEVQRMFRLHSAAVRRIAGRCASRTAASRTPSAARQGILRECAYGSLL